MKNLICFLSLLSIVILTGCSDKAIFNNSACAEFEIDEFIFNEAVEDVDLIAHVKINEIVGIQKSELPAAIFEADLIEVIKGETDKEKIKILQEKQCRFDPFEEGEEWVLFLNETVDLPKADYWIEGSHQGVFAVDNKKIEGLR